MIWKILKPLECYINHPPSAKRSTLRCSTIVISFKSFTDSVHVMKQLTLHSYPGGVRTFRIRDAGWNFIPYNRYANRGQPENTDKVTCCHKVHQLISWSRVLLKKLIFDQLVNILPEFYGTWGQLSQYRDGLRAGPPEFDSRQRQGTFLYSIVSILALGPTQPRI
jgi:hypothetical protein